MVILMYLYKAQGERANFLALLRTLMPFMGFYLHDLITSQGPQLLIPPSWGLDIKHGDTNVLSITHLAVYAVKSVNHCILYGVLDGVVMICFVLHLMLCFQIYGECILILPTFDLYVHMPRLYMFIKIFTCIMTVT